MDRQEFYSTVLTLFTGLRAHAVTSTSGKRNAVY